VFASHEVTATASLALETVTSVPANADTITFFPLKNTRANLFILDQLKLRATFESFSIG
jgi:hypothetical protein